MKDSIDKYLRKNVDSFFRAGIAIVFIGLFQADPWLALAGGGLALADYVTQL